MRKFFLTTVAVAAMFASPALAAPPTWTWTGFYVGGNAGYSWGRADGHVTLGGFTADADFPLDGFIGGGQFGYNWRSNN